MKKVNVLLLILGIFMIVVSFLNYLMNDDHVTLGIFIFSGVGFVLLSIKNKYSGGTANRLNKYAMTLFFGAVVILLYWVARVKFNVF